MNIRIYFLFLSSTILFGSQSVAYSQNTYLDSGDSDPEATEILNNLKEYITSQRAYVTDFTFHIEMPGYETQTIDGNIEQEGDNYYLQLDNQLIYTYKGTQWTYNREKNEVLIEERAPQSGSAILTPLEMLEFYESCDYIYALTQETTVNGKSEYEIEFKPLDKSSEYSKLRMVIKSKEQPQLKYLKIFNKDGSRYTLHVENLQVKKSIDPARFQFVVDDYPGIHVEDLRF